MLLCQTKLSTDLRHLRRTGFHRRIFQSMAFDRIRDFEIFVPALQKFREAYSLAVDRRISFNLCELAVLHQRGGRRVPTWATRRIESRPTALSFRNSLPPITTQLLFDLRHDLQRKIFIDRVIPRTKAQVFATFLASNICATAEGLAGHAGMTLKTARNWLRQAERAGLVARFNGGHEVFYLNFELLCLVTEGQRLHPAFLASRVAELSDLNSRNNWLNRSRIAVKFPDYYPR